VPDHGWRRQGHFQHRARDYQQRRTPRAVSAERVTQIDKDRIVGAGKLVGDAKLQADGKAMQVKGKLRNVIGSVKDTLPS
jgi:hypothetical protein